MMKKKSIYISFAVVISIVLIAGLFLIPEYRNYQTNLKEIRVLKQCQDSECFKKYYEDYTITHSREQAIKHFLQVINTDDMYTNNCHYIFHGIGAGSLVYYQNSLKNAFAVSMNGELFKNVPPTCGNGYFHGMMESYTGESTNEKELLIKIKDICEEVSTEDFDNKIDCYHGIGHGLYQQFGGDIQKSIKVCEQLSIGKSDADKMQSMCRTGVFMEMLRNSYDTSDPEKITSFEACEELDLKYQGECFNQQSYLLAEFGTKKEEFMQNLLECNAKFPKQNNTNNTFERVSCIRMFKF